LGVELVSGLMNLEESLLEDILGRSAVAKEPDEEVEQFALVTFYQMAKLLRSPSL
jgi:hypothetical protein